MRGRYHESKETKDRIKSIDDAVSDALACDKVRPFRPVKPGDIISEEMVARGLDPLYTRIKLLLTQEEFDQLSDGTLRIHARLAVLLARLFHTSAEFWINLDEMYVDDLKHQK